MAASPAALLRHLPTAEAPATDADLLRRYVETRDEAAFAELVRRHGPLVLRVCRNVLRDHSAADDAFQSTFLLLARNATRLTRSPSVAGWLHTVAVRTAGRVRRGEARRLRREQQCSRPAVSLPSDEPTWREVQERIDAELVRLPETYRLPILLCYVQGLTCDEAARQLGWSAGALRGRLWRGREILRRRLEAAGLMGIVIAVACTAPPTVAAPLRTATLAAVHKVRLARFGLPRSLFGRIVWGVAAGVAVTGLALAAVRLPVDPPKPNPPSPAAPTVATFRPPTDALGDDLPAGAAARLGTLRFCGPPEPRWAGFSPDGSKIASMSYRTLTVFDASTGRSLGERQNYWGRSNAVGWRADGVGVAVVKLPDQSYFISAFSDVNETLPKPPSVPPPPGRQGPDGLDFLALSPDATRLAVVRDPDEKQFTIDILPATTGQRVADLKPTRTLGPFPGPCREVRYTAAGPAFLTGDWKDPADWTLSFVDPDRNAVARAIRIPPPAYCVSGFMYSLSADAQFAAIPLRPKDLPAGQTFTNQHDGTIRVWDLQAGKELRSLPFPKVGYGTGHAFTPDGKSLITSTGEPYFRVWNLTTGEETARSPVPGGSLAGSEASAVATSPDGRRFATARRDGRVDVWETTTGKPVVQLKTHRDAIDAVAISSDSRLAATLGRDETVRIWELTTGNWLRSIPAKSDKERHLNRNHLPKPKLGFTPDGRGLLFPGSGQLMMVDPGSGKSIDLPAQLRDVKVEVGDLALDGRTLVTHDGPVGTLWDWPAGTVRAKFTVPLATDDSPRGPGPQLIGFGSLVLSPDSRFLFSSSHHRSAGQGVAVHPNGNDLWDARTGKLLHHLRPSISGYPPAAFASDGQVMYMGGIGIVQPGEGRSLADALTVRDPETGKLLRQFTVSDAGRKPFNGAGVGSMAAHVTSLAVSPDGRLLAAAEGWFSSDLSFSVWIYETVSGRVLARLVGHTRTVTDLAFAPNGRLLVSVAEDQTGLVWDVTLPALVQACGAKADPGVAAAWDRLAASDPALGYAGIATLVAAPAEGTRLLREKLRPAPVPTEGDLDRLVAKLGAAGFDEREKASAELDRFGPNAVAGAKARLAFAKSPEVRDRLKQFLSRYDGPTASPYQVRAVRGVAALEAIHSADARAILGELAKGKATDPLAREAAAALRRLGDR